MKLALTAALLTSALFGCGRPTLEELHTAVHTEVSFYTGEDETGQKTYSKRLVSCDIDVTVNNADGSIGIQYSNYSDNCYNYTTGKVMKKVDEALTARAEVVIEQAFPHLGDITAQ